jgi:undecaprenyl-diphosphatase
MSFTEALVLAIVEGLTEFLPVSSTGHMIVASALMGMKITPFVKLYTVAIQLGAILSVVVLYYRRFFKSVDFYVKLFVAFIPCVVAGILFSDRIDQLLENVMGVAIALLAGGIILLMVDKWFAVNERRESTPITNRSAFIIGIYQCLALFPGVSRSAATIIGGLSQKMNRKNAAEFSFFLAVPTMFAATAKKLLDFYKEGIVLEEGEASLLLAGNVIAFIVALIAIRSFISFLTRRGFRWFGWYRIIVGATLIIFFLAGKSIAIL